MKSWNPITQRRFSLPLVCLLLSLSLAACANVARIEVRLLEGSANLGEFSLFIVTEPSGVKVGEPYAEMVSLPTSLGLSFLDPTERTVTVCVTGYRLGRAIAEGCASARVSSARRGRTDIILDAGRCGDGSVLGLEVCDGERLAGETCVTQGFEQGTLTCGETCAVFNTAGCSSCPNGIAEGIEECDGSDLGGNDCVSVGALGGLLGCASDCTFDISGCDTCGNGVHDPVNNEACDGLDFGGRRCSDMDLGFVDGDLWCDPTCTVIDTVYCHMCGNDVVDLGEECDGTDLDNQTCGDLGFDGGTLGCLADCTFSTSSCVACGNRIWEPPEECDEIDLGGATCISLGFAGGVLACSPSCEWDRSDCHLCGNGIVDGPGEQCDPGNPGHPLFPSSPDLAGETCVSRGFVGGTLACAGDCQIDDSGCDNCGIGCPNDCGECCGNGACEPSESCDTCPSDCGSPCCNNGVLDRTLEECESGNLDGHTCVTLGHAGGSLGCDSTCQFDTTACVSCGNGVLDLGESCDGNDFGGASCVAGGNLTCWAWCNGTAQSCDTCGNGVAEGTEDCDLLDLKGVTCSSGRGTLACTIACTLDTTGCVP